MLKGVLTTPFPDRMPYRVPVRPESDLTAFERLGSTNAPANLGLAPGSNCAAANSSARPALPYKTALRPRPNGQRQFQPRIHGRRHEARQTGPRVPRPKGRKRQRAVARASAWATYVRKCAGGNPEVRPTCASTRTTRTITFLYRAPCPTGRARTVPTADHVRPAGVSTPQDDDWCKGDSGTSLRRG